MKSIIEPKENGPYLVKNCPALTNSKGTDLLPEKEVFALCRCGKSGNKPFCDGAHNKVGFSSASDEPSAGEWQEYVGRNITIHDNRHVCAHAGHCTDGLQSVWRMGQKPWIDPNGEEAEAIIAVIEQCPSGALAYSIDGKRVAPKAAANCIVVSADGPYEVSGEITLKDDSRDIDDCAGRLTLCRCGESKNKPFCDGSHWHIGFKDDKN